jgi:gas vesicle protein
MKLAVAAFGIAALVGVGYVIGKKVLEKRRLDEEFYDLDDFGDDIDSLANEDGIDVGVYAKQGYGKIKKASLFAVGAIKTGADKIGETICDIKTKDMIKKGEQTMDAVKETGGNIKNDIKRDIEDFKSMVSSINDEENTADSDLTEDLFEQAPDNVFEPKEEQE